MNDQPVTGRRAEGVQLEQRAAIYARVSTADQSCERQIAELTAFAERGGFEVLGISRRGIFPSSPNRPPGRQAYNKPGPWPASRPRIWCPRWRTASETFPVAESGGNRQSARTISRIRCLPTSAVGPMRPTCGELCGALEEQVAERQALHDDWTRGTGRFAEESDRCDMEWLDLQLTRYRYLLFRATQA